MAQNNDGPGKRLKREELKNTLYVSNPNDPRIQMYQDSLAAAVPAILGNKEIQYMNTLPMDKRREYYENEFLKNKKFEAPISSYEAANRLTDVNKKEYFKLKRNPFIKSEIEAPSGHHYTLGSNPQPLSSIIEYGMYENLPKRKVVFKREAVEPLTSRQPTFAMPEVISPVMRPVAVPVAPPMEEPMEAVIEEKPLVRKLPKAVMPQRQGGWGNQSIFMRAFPNLFAK